MPNPLYDVFGTAPSINDGGITELLNQARQLRQTFRGDPRQEVERLLASGQMTQQQFNQYSQIARRLTTFMR
jgi:hypothetical protein